MADDRLDIPKVKQGRKRSFSGLQQQIQSASADAAQFDAFANDMFADAAHDAKRKGAEAGRSAITLNSDGTVGRLAVPEAGQMYMEAYADQQRVAYLSATKQSFEAKTKDILQSLERNKNRDAEFQNSFNEMANTFISSAPDDVKQEITLTAQLLGSGGARTMARITQQEIYEENRATAVNGIDASLDRASSYALSMADTNGEPIVLSNTPESYAEAIAPFADAQAQIQDAYNAGLITPEEYREYQTSITTSIVGARLHKEMSGYNQKTLEVTKRLQDFVKSSDQVFGQDLSSEQRANIAKSVLAQITQRQTAITAERTAKERVQAQAVLQLETWQKAEDARGNIVDHRSVLAKAKELGIDVNWPKSALAVAKMTNSAVKERRQIVIEDVLSSVERTGNFPHSDYISLRKIAANDPKMLKQVDTAWNKHIKKWQKESQEINDDVAKGVITSQIQSGLLKADDIRAMFRGITADVELLGRKKSNLNARERYILKNKDSLIKAADKRQEELTGFTKANRRQLDIIRTKQLGNANSVSDATLLWKEGQLPDVFTDPNGHQIAVDFLARHGYMPDQIRQAFVAQGGGDGTRSPKAMYQMARIVLDAQNDPQKRFKLPSDLNTPAMQRVMQYVIENQSIVGDLNQMTAENQAKVLEDINKRLKLEDLPAPVREQLEQDVSTAQEDVKKYLAANAGYFHHKVFGFPSRPAQLAIEAHSPNTALGGLFGVTAETMPPNALSMFTRMYVNNLRAAPGNKERAMDLAIETFTSRHKYAWSEYGAGPDNLMNIMHQNGHMVYAPEKLEGNVELNDADREVLGIDPEDSPTKTGQVFKLYPNITKLLALQNIFKQHNLDPKNWDGPATLATDKSKFYLEAISSHSTSKRGVYRAFIKNRNGEWRQFGDQNGVTVLDGEMARQVLNVAMSRATFYGVGATVDQNFTGQKLTEQYIRDVGPLEPLSPILWTSQQLSRYYTGTAENTVSFLKWAASKARMPNWGNDDELPDPEVADDLKTNPPMPTISAPVRTRPPVQMTPAFANLIDSGVDADDELLDPPSDEPTEMMGGWSEDSQEITEMMGGWSEDSNEVTEMMGDTNPPAASSGSFKLSDKDKKIFRHIESSGNPTAAKGSSIGLYAFQLKTAQGLMPGITKEDLRNPDIQEELLDRYIAKNAKALGTTDPYVLYMAHQQGVRGYKLLLKMRDVRIKDIRDRVRKEKVMENRRPETKRDKNATVGDFLDQWKRHYTKLQKEL